MMIISIIIPVHNRLELTINGLTSLKKIIDAYDKSLLSRRRLKLEVVVVDDGSTDGTPEWIRANYPNFHLLNGDGNLWWTGAVDKGSRYSIDFIKVDYVVLWNDDIFADENYFLVLENVLLTENNKNVLYGSVIYEYPNVENVWSMGGYFNRYLGLRRMHKNKNSEEVRWFAGMGTIISAEILVQMNFFDYKNFPHYHGDIDFSLRVYYEKGLSLKLIPELKIWNRIEHSSFIAKESWSDYYKSLVNTQSRYNLKKEIKFFRRHTITPFWLIVFLKRQTSNFFSFLNTKYTKNS